jgi:hypothetical protein
MEKEVIEVNRNTKNKNLGLGILFDAIECCPYSANGW